MTTDMVIEMNKGLIISCVNKFYNADKEDLYQAGVLGLLKAYKNYKYDGKTKFSTYAYKYIYGEMYLLANSSSIKVNKNVTKLVRLIEKTKYMLAQKLNRIPSNEELSKFLHIPLSDLENALLSINEIVSLEDYDNQLSKKENYDNKLLIIQGLKYLSDNEKRVILERYYNDLTQEEIAKKMDISQVTVSRYEKRSLIKLHDYMKV